MQLLLASLPTIPQCQSHPPTPTTPPMHTHVEYDPPSYTPFYIHMSNLLLPFYIHTYSMFPSDVSMMNRLSLVVFLQYSSLPASQCAVWGEGGGGADKGCR